MCGKSFLSNQCLAERCERRSLAYGSQPAASTVGSVDVTLEHAEGHFLRPPAPGTVASWPRALRERFSFALQCPEESSSNGVRYGFRQDHVDVVAHVRRGWCGRCSCQHARQACGCRIQLCDERLSLDTVCQGLGTRHAKTCGGVRQNPRWEPGVPVPYRILPVADRCPLGV